MPNIKNYEVSKIAFLEGIISEVQTEALHFSV